MHDKDTPERWLPVVGYEGLYEVSDRGRVRSLSRAVRHRNGRTHRMTGRVLAHAKDGGGYHFVGLSHDGATSLRKVYRIVLEAFVGPAPAGHTDGAHNDGDRANNRLDNLRWATRRDNCADKVRHGTATTGERNPSAKLTEADVRVIRARIACGATQQAVADAFGVSRSLISMIASRRVWA